MVAARAVPLGTTVRGLTLSQCCPQDNIVARNSPPRAHRSHMAPNYTDFPFPRPLFDKFIRENGGGQRAGTTFWGALQFV